MIETCAFGSMVIDGRRYQTDLIITPDGRVTDGWWREAGHRLSLKDIAPLVEAGSEIIIAGTGVNGRMRPALDLEKLLAQKGIRFYAAANEEAVGLYNQAADRHRVGACFHLYC